MNKKELLKGLLLFSFIPFILSSCSFQLTPATRNTSKQEESNKWEDVDRDITKEEYDEILVKAVEEEKNNLKEFDYHISSADSSVQDGNRKTTRYLGGYCEANFIYYDDYYVLILSSKDYSHNYYTTKRDGVISDNITDITADSFENDAYLMVYGYGQQAFCPAAFLAIYGKIMTPINMHMKNNQLTFTMTDYADVEIKLNSKGAITHTYVKSLSDMKLVIEGDSSYTPREQAPQYLVNTFVEQEV